MREARLYVILGSHACRTGASRSRRGCTGPMRARAGRFVFDATAGVEGRLQAELPAMLDRVDSWIADGVLNGEPLNAADYMITPSLALLWYVRALRPQLEPRPSLALVDRLLPNPAA